MIHLIGPGGAGKSTAGAVLAKRLALPFHDLDVYFTGWCGQIDDFIAAEGYMAYAQANVSAYEHLLAERGSAVVALSSGFMTYPLDVHPGYPEAWSRIARNETTFVLLPSLDVEVCVAETVRRQLARPIVGRTRVREEAVIRERFGSYVSLPVPKVTTMRPPGDIAADIAGRLAPFPAPFRA